MAVRGLIGGGRQTTPPAEDIVAALLASARNIPVQGQPLPPAQPSPSQFSGGQPTLPQQNATTMLNAGPPQNPAPASPPPGLFGGKPQSTGQMAAAVDQLTSPTLPAAPERRRPNFFTRLGEGITDALNPGTPMYDQRQATEFGDRFGALIGDPNPQNQDQRITEMRRMLVQRAAQGHDVTGLERILETYRQDSLGANVAQSLPEPLQAYGRYAPSAGAAFGFDQGANDIYTVDGRLYRGAKGGGEFETVAEPPPRPEFGFAYNEQGGIDALPGGPADPDYRYARQYQDTRGQQDATPRAPTPPVTESQVVGAVMQKAQTQGIESLTPAERQIFDRQVTIPQPANPFAFMGAPGMGGQPNGQQPGYGQPQPQQGQPRQQGPASGQGGVARPQTDADFARLPSGARYIDPDDGQLYEKQ